MKRTESKQEGLYTPLAARLRPKTLDDFRGHVEVLGKGKSLRRAIERGAVGSLILWGPPGVGKTTLAELIARNMSAAIERVSAVTAGVKDLRDVLARAAEWRKIQKPTVLIVDEIHRFNKSQQDVLLPAVEEGLVIMIGATTENPYFEVVSALLSRAQVVRMEILKDKDMKTILKRAEAEYPMLHILPDAIDAIVKRAGGDARRALNILERATGGKKRGDISAADVESAAHGSAIHYDKTGDIHYDTISAFIKSLRGSDADAALFYLFRMLAAGEDPKFIVRRMFIFASEDIGNADPHALMVASAAGHGLEWVGLPEAEYILAHAACYLAAAPKSDSVKNAMYAVKNDVALHGNDTPPGHITNAPIEGMKTHGRGVGYKNPHEFPSHVAPQQYRPSSVQSHIYYIPGEEGFEKEVKRRIEAARKVIYGE